MKKEQKFTRNLGGKEFGHGGDQGVGDAGNNQTVPARHEVNLVPADSGNDAPANTPARGDRE